jgi:transcription elongation GreA/GreB family factor
MSSRFPSPGTADAFAASWTSASVGSAPSREVSIGSRVRVRDLDGEEEFLIVDHAEADAAFHRISILSPLGSALIGRQAGESVRVRTPVGVRSVVLVAVY